MKELILKLVLKIYFKARKVAESNFLKKSYKKLLVSLTARYLCVINTSDGEKRYEN
jgi:hypothetical protein